MLDGTLGLVMNPDACTTTRSRRWPISRPIDAFFVAGADPVANHTGARGIAEPPMIPTAPAIAAAVSDAIGVDVTRDSADAVAGAGGDRAEKQTLDASC